MTATNCLTRKINFALSYTPRANLQYLHSKRCTAMLSIIKQAMPKKRKRIVTSRRWIHPAAVSDYVMWESLHVRGCIQSPEIAWLFFVFFFRCSNVGHQSTLRWTDGDGRTKWNDAYCLFFLFEPVAIILADLWPSVGKINCNNRSIRTCRSVWRCVHLIRAGRSNKLSVFLSSACLHRL